MRVGNLVSLRVLESRIKERVYCHKFENFQKLVDRASIVERTLQESAIFNEQNKKCSFQETQFQGQSSGKREGGNLGNRGNGQGDRRNGPNALGIVCFTC